MGGAVAKKSKKPAGGAGGKKKKDTINHSPDLLASFALLKLDAVCASFAVAWPGLALSCMSCMV